MDKFKNILWLVALVILFLPSCKDGEDVNGGEDYYYYLNIQSEVRLSFKEEDEEQGTMTNSKYDLLSRTILFMQKAVQDNNSSMKGDNLAKEAAMITTCDSLYRNYADLNPASKGFLICYVKLIRCSLYPNGTIKNALPIKYYNFWYEMPEGWGDDDGSSPGDYLAKPDSLKAVDLGLSVLWANCNIGAKQPRDYGAHPAWGDSTGVLFSAQGIGWNDNGYTWNTENYGGNNPPADISGSELDVVTKYWGDGWRIPTVSEAKELCEQCQWKLQTWGDVKWYEVIGPNGNSIIMPLAGIYRDDMSKPSSRFHSGPWYVNEWGFYWTSTSCPTPSTAEQRGYGVNDGVVTAWHFRFNSNNGDGVVPVFIDYIRAYHMSIRPVHDK
ncbi:MAG: hypothetical protein IKX18_00690 [Muribaculaceae bacterium]|nr:hypothetical protein [Muribaculaceae bacterium]